MFDPGMQHTLASEARLEGVGFLSGRPVRVVFRPAEVDTGIVFIRTDVPSAVRIPADVRHVQVTPRRTTLAAGSVAVEMVEHALAALAGLGIDNCEVHLDSAELPGGDGSAAHFVECLHRAGAVAQGRRRRILQITEPVHVGDASAAITAVPCTGDATLLSYHVDYGPDSPIAPQSRLYKLPSDRFSVDLAPARTFLLMKEAEQLRGQGLGATVTAKDLVIFGPEGPIDNVLRFPDEPVRHKLLDMVGDLSLIGCRLAGHVSGYRSGHRLNSRMVERLLEVCGNADARRPAPPADATRPGKAAKMPLTPRRGTTRSKPLRVGVVGVGHMGKVHARVLSSLPDSQLVGVADASPSHVQAAARQWNVPGYVDFHELFRRVDAVTIAVPTMAHAAVAREFLARGVPVLIEKPLCATVAEADELIDLSRRHGALIQVGHSERFNPAFVAALSHLESPKFIQAVRSGPYTHRSTDIGVVLDLMVHDLDLLHALTGSKAKSVEALGISVFGQHEDAANARVVFDNGCVASLSASRASPLARRRLQIWSARGYADLDLAKRQVQLVRCPGHPPDEQEDDAAARAVDWTPISHTADWPIPLEECRMAPPDCEPLAEQFRQFVQCVRGGASPWVGAHQGREALVLAERVLACIERHQWDGDPRGLIGPHLRDGSIIPPPHFHLVPARSRQEQSR